MGARGPKPRPTHLKVLQGEQESRINRDEPVPSEGAVRPPAFLEGEALEVWNYYAPDLIDKGVLQAWDVDTFAVYCQAVSQYRECVKLLYSSDSGYGRFIDKGAAGGLIKSPYHQMLRDCVETIMKVSSRFAFTPGDRAALRVERGDSGPRSGAERILS